MKYYKFRPLADSKDEERAKNILETGCFWCAKFIDLNDPMEGVFSVSPKHNIDAAIDRIYTEKNKYKICSFSGFKGFGNPSMWGYYANGFKGIAIEVEIENESLEEVIYIREISELEDQMIVKKLLLRKLDSWKHEQEYRFMTQSNNNYHPIGTITAVYFGNPYNGFSNRRQLCNGSQSLREYEERKERLKRVVKSQNIELCSVEISHGTVVKIPK